MAHQAPKHIGLYLTVTRVTTENCEIPSLEPSYAIVNGIRRLAHQYGSVKSFKAYLEYPEQLSLKSLALRSELQSCGVSLIDCPHNGRKDVADKMMMSEFSLAIARSSNSQLIDLFYLCKST